MVNGGLLVHTIPKVASTSMSAAMVWTHPRRAHPTEDLPGFRFMAVRHPLERLVSAWLYFTPGDKLKHMQVFRHNVYKDMPFAEFVRVVLENPNKDRHTRQQDDWRGGQKIDCLVKLENLPREWNKMVGKYPVVEIPHKNSTDHSEWWSYYTPDLARDALAVYGGDLELYENAA